MKTALFSLLVLILLIILLQDFRYLAVTWILFPAGYLVGAIITISSAGLNVFVQYLLLNIGFIALVLGFILFYVYLKFRSFSSLIKKLGTGDILFFFLPAFILSPLNFIVFNSLSFILALIIYGFYYVYDGKKDRKIPLAGFQSLCILFLLGFDYFSTGFTMLNDLFIHQLALKSINF